MAGATSNTPKGQEPRNHVARLMPGFADCSQRPTRDLLFAFGNLLQAVAAFEQVFGQFQATNARFDDLDLSSLFEVYLSAKCAFDRFVRHMGNSSGALGYLRWRSGIF